jgi:DNA-directed RNA polymerase II subunit RPB2
MEELGFKHHGYHRLYCGSNGNWINSMIYMGPVYYQRLQKFISRSVYSINVGPTDMLTRQPLDGKANQGGIRIGEMERDVMLSHGCARFFSEKFFDHSDDFEIYYCKCGSQAIVNHFINDYRCPNCHEMAEVNAVYSTWTSNILIKQLNAMHIGTKIKLKPLRFFTHEE